MEYNLNGAVPVDLSKACIFVMVKPGFSAYIDKIINEFQSDTLDHRAWTLVRKVTKTLTLDEAHEIYGRQADAFWYEDGCAYLTSDESTGLLFVRSDEPMDERKNFNEAFNIKCKLRDTLGFAVQKNGDVATLLHTADDLTDLKIEAPIYFGLEVFLEE